MSYSSPGPLKSVLLLFLIGVSLCSPGIPTVLAAGKPGPFKILGSHKLGPHQPHTVNKDGGACDPKNCGTPPLLAKGGTIIHDPQMYLIFWGPWWQSSEEVSSGIVPGMQSLYANLAGGQYNKILSQYTDSSGAPNNFVHNNVKWVTSAYDTATSPPTSLTMAAIGQEVLNVMAANQWTNTANTMVMVFPQKGTTYDSSFNTPGDETCGEHAYGTAYGGIPAFVVFGMVRYTPDTGSACNYSALTTDSSGHIVESTAGDMQDIASHEYAEMATNPATGVDPAWVTSDGYEIADLCNWGAQSYTPINISTPLWVTQLWDNSAKTSSYPNGQCMSASGQEYLSPDTSTPFNGKHTVQGGILGKYQSAYTDPQYSKQYPTFISLLGAPLSEETPISSLSVGRVSYFAGQICNGGYTIPSSSQNENGGGGLTSGSAIYYGGSAGIHEVHGCIYHEYTAVMGGPGGLLGFPVSDEQDAVYGGRVSYFVGNRCSTGSGPYNSGSAIYYNAGNTHFVWGCIYAQSGSPGYEVHGCIDQKYESVGGPNSNLGFPISDEYTNSAGYRESDFVGGSIVDEHGAIVISLNCIGQGKCV